MTKPRCVSVRVAVAIATFAVLPSVARAELPNGSMLTFEMLRIHEDGGPLREPSTPDALRLYLNQAHCVCGRAMAGLEQTIAYEVGLTIDTNTDRPAELWVGTNCDDDMLRATQCRQIGTIENIDNLVVATDTIEFALADVIAGFSPIDMANCDGVDGDRFLWTLVDSDGDGMYDDKGKLAVGTTTEVTGGFDTAPPPIATAFEGASAERSIRLSWDAPETTSDIYAYQALCAKPDGSPALEDPDAGPRYQTVRELCGLEADNIVVTDTDVAAEGGTATIPDAMRQLDPSYICGESLEQTAAGMLIDGLDNDVAYSVIVVAVDQYGNAVGAALNRTITPRPATDFWEDLHDRGSNVEGGFCLAGGTIAGTGGPLALALGFLLLRRRRRVAGFAAATTIALVLLVPRTASAQGVPYWEEQQELDAQLASEDLVRWHVGLRVGPYVPDIDKQFGGTAPGPYEEMFGGYQIMPMIDIDRIVWRGFGQLGFGGSIGYMQKTANAWADGSVPGDPMRMRSSGDENTFRLVPVAATVVYRFTWLDDNYGIPVVPYVRGGLSYYLWWIRTNNDTSSSCWDGTRDPDCDADKAIGATIGVQGAIGLAIRAERIDSATATSMRAGGIMHAGFYGELSLAKVDGFGSDYKLSVGDATWFAGVNFEF